MKVLAKYADGSGRVEVLGVVVTVDARGEVFSLSDWSRVGELIEAGYLSRNVWRGGGLYGHDTYTMAGG